LFRCSTSERAKIHFSSNSNYCGELTISQKLTRNKSVGKFTNYYTKPSQDHRPELGKTTTIAANYHKFTIVMNGLAAKLFHGDDDAIRSGAIGKCRKPQ
jgi:aspartate 1-decarboxylase